MLSKASWNGEEESRTSVVDARREVQHVRKTASVRTTGYLYRILVINDLFLMFDFDHETNSIVVKRKKRDEHEEEMYMCVNLSTHNEIIGDLEYEIDEEKFIRKRKYWNTTNG